jgi:hypothetical protein
MTPGVERHYSSSDSLVDAIAASLRAAGIDPERVAAADLAPVDEFHIRGRAATLELADAMGVDADTSVLDICDGAPDRAFRARAEATCGSAGLGNLCAVVVTGCLRVAQMDGFAVVVAAIVGDGIAGAVVVGETSRAGVDSCVLDPEPESHKWDVCPYAQA